MFDFWKRRKERKRIYKSILQYVNKNLSIIEKYTYSFPKERKETGSVQPTFRVPHSSGIQYSLAMLEKSFPKLVRRDGEVFWLDGDASMPTFTNEVKRLMNERGLTSTELCSRVLMDRRLWSKLNTDSQYQPSRETAFAICIALRLNEEEAQELLLSAGFALSSTRKQDVIMRYFLENEIYDIDVINDMFYRFGFKCIGTNVKV